MIKGSCAQGLKIGSKRAGADTEAETPAVRTEPDSSVLSLKGVNQQVAEVRMPASALYLIPSHRHMWAMDREFAALESHTQILLQRTFIHIVTDFPVKVNVCENMGNL